MRQLAERVLEGAGRRGAASRSISRNHYSAGRARGLIDGRQFEAGERLRGDYEMAALGPRVTMRWEARVDGGGGDGLDPATAQIAAKRRFDAAVEEVGPGLNDVLWRVVCACEGLPATEKALGWPVRAGRVVLTLALDRLARHYGLR